MTPQPNGPTRDNLTLPKGTNFLEWALYYASLGWRVIPCEPRGKRALLRNWPQEATTDPAKIREWWGRQPEANIAVLCGGGLAVLDFDPRAGGDYWDSLDLPATWVVHTGGGGRHYYYLAPQGLRGRKLDVGLDLKGEGGYVIAPPSVHPSGGRYEWEVGASPWETRVGRLPEWVEKGKEGNAAKEGKRRRWEAEVIPEGERNNTLTSYAGWLRSLGLSEAEILTLLLRMNAEKCIQPLPEKEVAQIARSISRYEPRRTPPEPDQPPKPTLKARDLLDMRFPLPTWRVAGLLPEGGLTLLAAEAKLGKTWLGLQIAEAVAGGGEVFGRAVRESGAVLYVAYEDGLARLRDRIILQAWGEQALENVYIRDGAELTKPEGREDLAKQVRELGVKLVIIDTLRAALRDARIEENQAEFSTILYSLREAINQAGASLLVVHHHRKARTGDISIDLRGTSALSGAADMLLGLYRKDGKIYLAVRGRDLPTGDQVVEIAFDPTAHRWVSAIQKTLNETERAILEALAGPPLAAKDLIARLGVSHKTIYEALNRLEAEGYIVCSERRTAGRPVRVYTLPEAQRPPMPQDGQQSLDQAEREKARLVVRRLFEHPGEPVGVDWVEYSALVQAVKEYSESLESTYERVAKAVRQKNDAFWKRILEAIKTGTPVSLEGFGSILSSLDAVLLKAEDAETYFPLKKAFFPFRFVGLFCELWNLALRQAPELRDELRAVWEVMVKEAFAAAGRLLREIGERTENSTLKFYAMCAWHESIALARDSLLLNLLRAPTALTQPRGAPENLNALKKTLEAAQGRTAGI